MTQEGKDLLLKDLAARLPYGVICYGVTKDTDEDDNYIDKGVTDTLYELHSYKCCYGLVGLMNECDIETIKPYLRPMSSMTKEERKEYENLFEYEEREYNQGCCFFDEYKIGIDDEYRLTTVIDWLNAHHFDYRGLIEKGLAIEVTEDNNPYE